MAQHCAVEALDRINLSLPLPMRHFARKYKKYKWGVVSNWSSRRWSWRHEIMDAGSESACG